MIQHNYDLYYALHRFGAGVIYEDLLYYIHTLMRVVTTLGGPIERATERGLGRNF